MKTIFIAENNLEHLEQLRKWIESQFSDIHLLVAKTFEDGRNIIENNHIDLSILDIGLTNDDDELGIQLAEQIRQKYPYNTIIFQTVKYDHKYQTEIHSRIGSVVYLVKQDLTKDSLTHVIQRELGRFQTPLTSFIFIKEKSGRTSFPTHKILHIDKVNNEHDAKFFFYNYTTGKVTVKMFRISLADIMKQSGAKGFLIKCHQSHIINQQMMEYTTVEDSIHKVKIQYTDELIPIGRTFRDETLKALERKLRR
jgi:DNA-binding LytR/AlgR family response regulator